MTKILPPIRAIIFSLRKRGKSLREISAELAKYYDVHISHTTVQYHLDEDYRMRAKRRSNIRYRRERGLLL